MRTSAVLFVTLLAGCGNESAPLAAADGTDSVSSATVASSTTRVATYPTFKDRAGELVNPDESSMVMLYFDLSAMTPPLDQWVEEDTRVQMAPGAKKAALRSQVRSELEATAASVRNVGVIRVSISTQLSPYDTTYGEYTISGLAPSSLLTFKSMGQEVSLRFGNGRAAQIWAVPQPQAQSIDDALGYDRSVTVDALLHISGVQPAPRGGTIVADVVEYELHQTRDQRLLARVTVPRS